MNVFLTWSGKRSHAIALALYEWVPSVLQRVKPFISSEDIRKGSRWQTEIAAKLAEVQFSIVCLTADNLSAPWIHFEAGAVSKHVQSGKVTALLVGVVPSDLQGPLAQFQHTSASREDVRKLMAELNESLGPDALRAEQFADTFDTYWPRLATKLRAVQEEAGAPEAPKRPVEEMVAELLEINRNNERAISALVHVQQELYEHMVRLDASWSSNQIGALWSGLSWARGGLSALGKSPPDTTEVAFKKLQRLIKQIDMEERGQKPASDSDPETDGKE